MIITDEMVESAQISFQLFAGREMTAVELGALGDALVAVAPLIAKAVIEECAARLRETGNRPDRYTAEWLLGRISNAE